PETAAPPADPSVAAWSAVLLLLEQHGPRGQTVEALDRFLAAYPDSRFAPEASALLLLVRGTSGPPGPTMEALEAWIAANPGHPRRLEIEALAGSVARDGLRDCTRAMPHDRIVAERASGAVRARSQAFLGLCLVEVGKREEGLGVLDEVDVTQLD